MISRILPSPNIAMQYRAKALYKGPQNDEICLAMQNCNPAGPLMVQVTQLMQTDSQKLYAFGRVFSGTIKSEMKVRILGNNYVQGKKDDLYEKSIQDISLLINNKLYKITQIPAGNIVVIHGIDQFIKKQATITTHPHADIFRNLQNNNNNHIQKIIITPKLAQNLPKLIEGLKKLSQVYQSIDAVIEDVGDYTIVGDDQQQLQNSFEILQNQFCKDIQIEKSDVIQFYRETITAESNQVCLAKSPNKHSRLYCKACPLQELLVQAIENNTFDPQQYGNDLKFQSQKLVEDFQWDLNDAKKIWCFGPNFNGPNLFLDQTKGVQYLHEIKDHVSAGFQYCCREGVLCEEQCRQIQINLLDVVLQTNSVHRGGGQTIPMVRRVFYSSQLTANPTLQAPYLQAEYIFPREQLNDIFHNIIQQHRAELIQQEDILGSDFQKVVLYMPFDQLTNFQKTIEEFSQGFALCLDYRFCNWKNLQGTPFDLNSICGQQVQQIRQRKGLAYEIPDLSQYLDKI